jgi:hypothetical protein
MDREINNDLKKTIESKQGTWNENQIEWRTNEK